MPDREELVELLSRYASMADTRDWASAPSVLCEEIACDFSSLGAPAGSFTRDAWCAATARAFSGFTATHHSITNHLVSVGGDGATVRAHVRAEHWSAAGCWLVVGFYDDVAVRTPQGWRLSSITLTATHQERHR